MRDLYRAIAFMGLTSLMASCAVAPTNQQEDQVQTQVPVVVALPFPEPCPSPKKKILKKHHPVGHKKHDTQVPVKAPEASSAKTPDVAGTAQPQS